jgi:hypothetical protein
MDTGALRGKTPLLGWLKLSNCENTPTSGRMAVYERSQTKPTLSLDAYKAWTTTRPPSHLTGCLAQPHKEHRMTIRDIKDFVEDHYDEFPNFDGRSVEEVLEKLPENDPRYENVAGLVDILNEVNYRLED